MTLISVFLFLIFKVRWRVFWHINFLCSVLHLMSQNNLDCYILQVYWGFLPRGQTFESIGNFLVCIDREEISRYNTYAYMRVNFELLGAFSSDLLMLVMLAFRCPPDQQHWGRHCSSLCEGQMMCLSIQWPDQQPAAEGLLWMLPFHLTKHKVLLQALFSLIPVIVLWVSQGQRW